MTNKKGAGLILLAGIIWGSNGVLANFIVANPMVIVFFRVSIASLGILVGIVLTRQWSHFDMKDQKRTIILLGILLTLTWSSLFIAFQLIPIGIAVLLNYTAPIFVVIFAYYYLHEQLTYTTGIAILISLVGISLISGVWSSTFNLNLIGVMAGLLAGISYAVFIVVAKKSLTQVSQLTVSFYTYLLASCILFPFPLSQGVPIDFISIVYMLLLGLVNTTFAVTIYFYGLPLVKAQEAAVLAYMEPLSAIVFGAILLNQLITLETVIGGGLICLAGGIVAFQKS